MLTLKGTEVSLSYVQCFLYVVSSSVNICIFHITWMDSFWTDLRVPVLYSAFLWLFSNYPFVLVNPFPFPLVTPAFLSSENCQSVFCVYESVSILFITLCSSLGSKCK